MLVLLARAHRGFTGEQTSQQSRQGRQQPQNSRAYSADEKGLVAVLNWDSHDIGQVLALGQVT